jgi:two-component system chemotaxis sensor kinase CheA
MPNRTIEDLKNYIHASVEIYRTTRILLFLGSLTRNELKEIRKLKIKNVTPKKIEKEAPASLDSNFTDPAPVKFEKNLAEQHSPQNKEIKSLRIDSTKLDKLINLVGELVIAGANISQVASLEKNSALIESSFLLNRLIGEVRENSLKIRMVQIGETFNRFHRTVRDIGQELGKDIRLEITGGESELDKTVVEKISDPLTHLVRNAIDHGIETSEERKKLGKPGLGHLILHAYHETGNIIIEVKDDGKGLDQDRIIQKAIEKEIITPGKNYTKEEIFRLIFKPGFSTAEKVTNLSGRGVGLDVVERNIESLRGSVEVESEKGVGTTFRIRLPLTLAIIDGFLFRVGDNYYVVPLDMVEECIEFSNEMVDPGKRNFFHLRDNLLPFISLRELFVTNGKSSKRKNILVVKHGTKRAGLLVDSLEGETQTVIRPLGKLFSRVKWASGSTILGSGDVAMILDIPALIHKAQETEEKVKQKLDI